MRQVFSIACLAVAGYYVAALIAHSGALRGDAGLWRVSGYELSRLGMALGMAAMFSPLGDPVPRLVWLIVFGIAAAWFAVCLLHAGTSADNHSSAPADDAAHHHLVANLAMLFMVAGGHSRHGAGGAAAGGPVSSGHEGHTAAAGGNGLLEGPIGTVLIVVLAVTSQCTPCDRFGRCSARQRRRSRHRRTPGSGWSRLSSHAAGQSGCRPPAMW